MFNSEEEKLITSIQSLNLWSKSGQRAPHKPLLLLLYLGQIQQSGERLISFSSIDDTLRELLKDYGPPRKSFHSEYPFWRLQNDGIWEVISPVHLLTRASNTDAKRSELLKYDAKGGLIIENYRLLRRNPALIQSAAEMLLRGNFPPSLYAEITARVGLGMSLSSSKKVLRDATFRQQVLRAYDFRCALCGYDARLGTIWIGLEAAHIKWHQAGGPDTVRNGLALCTLHHKAFDRGAITLSKEHRLLLSSDLTGNKLFNEMFLKLQGRAIRPQKKSLLPEAKFIKWHHREVFRRPDRSRVLE